VIALLLAVALSPLPVGVERSRDTLPTTSIRVSTSLDTNGEKTDRQTAIDAERAFAADAQSLGQWTAFRKWASADATMFVPQPVKTQQFLQDRKNPPTAVQWWAASSFVSCDGGYAVNTGPWLRAAQRSVGYFTTVWTRRDGGWKWLVDSGDALGTPRAAGDTPVIRKGSCKGVPSSVAAVRYRDGDTGEGQSDDHTLAWRWHAAPDGARSLDVWLWNGRTMVSVIADRIAAAQ
jgi:hypothetical protein